MKKALCILFLLTSPLRAEEPTVPEKKSNKTLALIVSLFTVSIVTIVLASHNLDKSSSD
jgi:hypothetical protein